MQSTSQIIQNFVFFVLKTFVLEINHNAKVKTNIYKSQYFIDKRLKYIDLAFCLTLFS